MVLKQLHKTFLFNKKQTAANPHLCELFIVSLCVYEAEVW